MPMKEMKIMKNKLIIAFYLLSIILLALSMKMRIHWKNRPKPYLVLNEIFDLQKFIDSEKYQFHGEKIKLKSNHITALYVINSAGCSPCINNVISFNYYLEKKDFNGISVQQFVVAIDSSKKRLLRFVKTAEFVTPVAFGYDEKYAPYLQSFGKSRNSSQLLFISNDYKKVFFRLLLSKGQMTSDIYKDKMINNAEQAFILATKKNY